MGFFIASNDCGSVPSCESGKTRYGVNEAQSIDVEKMMGASVLIPVSGRDTVRSGFLPLMSHCTSFPSPPKLKPCLGSACENLKSVTPLSCWPERLPTMRPSVGANKQTSEVLVP